MQTFATYYIWDFGDGSPIVRSEEHFNVEVQSKVYASRGVYTVTVTAYNTYGINSTSMMVYVGGETRPLHCYIIIHATTNYLCLIHSAPKMLTIFMSGDQRGAGSNITFTLMLGEVSGCSGREGGEEEEGGTGGGGCQPASIAG